MDAAPIDYGRKYAALRDAAEYGAYTMRAVFNGDELGAYLWARAAFSMAARAQS